MMTSLTLALLENSTNVTVEETLLFTHLLSIGGFILAIIVLARLLIEQRSPSNIYAWGLLIVFIPYLGVPLYLLFGGRKIRKLVEGKRQIRKLAVAINKNISSAMPPRNYDRSEGNSVTLLPNGVAAYEALCRNITQAKKQIHLMTYILGKDDTAKEIIDLLAQRAQDGIDVCLLVDALGSLGNSRHLKTLEQNGGHVARFMPVIPIYRRASANLRNHRKLAIFDHECAIVGGQNIDGRFISKTAHKGLFYDMALEIKGPALNAFNQLFISDWCYASGTNPRDFSKTLNATAPPSGDETLSIITSGPDVDNDPLWEQMILLIQECREEIILVTPYFIPDEVIYQSLLVKAMAGYRVKVIVPLESNQRVVDFARGHFLRSLHKAGADVQFYTKGMLHAKLIIADNKRALTGSANIDMRSLFLNFEVGILHESQPSVSALTLWTEELLKDCVAYPETHYHHSSIRRRRGEDIAKLFVPLL